MAFRFGSPYFQTLRSNLLLMLRGLVLAPIIVIVLEILCAAVFAQTQAETRQQLLQQVEAGRLPDAISLGDKAVRQWPDDAEIRHWLGLAYFKAGQLAPAREQLEHARDLNKREPSAHFDLAPFGLSQQELRCGCRRTTGGCVDTF
jgi:tetratricopeptide (TPR) repeat protein